VHPVSFFVAESSIAGEWDDYSRYAGIDAVELQSPVCYLYSENPLLSVVHHISVACNRSVVFDCLDLASE
jgi:hypothetical protein